MANASSGSLAWTNRKLRHHDSLAPLFCLLEREGITAYHQAVSIILMVVVVVSCELWVVGCVWVCSGALYCKYSIDRGLQTSGVCVC